MIYEKFQKLKLAFLLISDLRIKKLNTLCRNWLTFGMAVDQKAYRIITSIVMNLYRSIHFYDFVKKIFRKKFFHFLFNLTKNFNLNLSRQKIQRLEIFVFFPPLQNVHDGLDFRPLNFIQEEKNCSKKIILKIIYRRYSEVM